MSWIDRIACVLCRRALVFCLPAAALWILALPAGAAPVSDSARPADTPALLQYPDIRGDVIVFTYEGDLWRTTVQGGSARRLTTHPGTEMAARISPDGRTIAFTGEYDGSPAVYTMPIDGGQPTRVTYIGTGVRTVGWTPDGKRIVFRSGHENTFRPVPRLYTVPRDGGWATRMPPDRGILCSFNADGSKMVYNRKGNEEYYWKRYKGGQYTDIWLYDFRANAYAALTDYVGKNAYPMWCGDEMFFVSDRGANGIANLYTYDFGSKAVAPVTTFDDFDVQMPSSDGRSVVFVHAGGLAVIDAASLAVRDVRVQLPSDDWTVRERVVNPEPWIQSMGASDDGKWATFEARGDVFVVPADENLPTRNLTNTAGVRERFPQISPDGKRVAYFSDRTGEYQLYVQDVSGERPAEQITTTLDRTVYHLEWSPDGTKVLFGNKDFALFYVDVASRKLVRFASSNELQNDEFYWEVSDYCWSPDSKWIAYSFVQSNHNNQIFLYNLERNESRPVTRDFYDSLNPSFDADGQYLYFLSYRNFRTRIDIFEDDHVIPAPVRVMVAQLEAGQRPPFAKAPKEDEGEGCGAAEDEGGRGDQAYRGGRGDRNDRGDRGDRGEKAGKAGKSAPVVRIDLDGLADRIYEAPIDPGNYFYLKAGKGLVTFAAKPDYGEQEIGETFTPSAGDSLTLHVFCMKDRKDAVLDSWITDWRTSANREHAIVRKGGDWFLVDLAKLREQKKLGDPLSLDKMAYTVVPRAEWTQIFNDAWRWYRDFFYDPGMHGHDWKALGDKFRAFLPALASRADLNWLLSQMVGELCVSHTYVGGGDYGPQTAPEVRVYTGLLGADLTPDANGWFRFARIFGPTEIERGLESPLVRPDVAVKEGDYLIAIDGHQVRAPGDPYRWLQVVKGQKVRLTVSDRPSAADTRVVDVEPVRSEMRLRYNRWLSDNVAKVLQETHGDVGYMHIQAMSTDNIGQFDKFWRAFRYKNGLIIDVRGNGGGWTEYFLIDKLKRQMVGLDVLRNMVPFRYPGSSHTGPVVVLSNEYNGSDGEAFLEHFRAVKLGTIIGVPSWGGLVGVVNGQATLDGGNVEQSNNSFYGREGKWWVENHGVDPDIRVDNDPASASAGKDAQLDRAIEVIQQQIREHPFTFPQQPPYPKR